MVKSPFECEDKQLGSNEGSERHMYRDRVLLISGTQIHRAEQYLSAVFEVTE